jgi:hypothetical protein
MIEWNEDYLDLLTLFARHKVEHMVIGAYALGLHGLPRATGDIDVFVNATKPNSRRVIAALRAFGAPLTHSKTTARDFEKPGVVFQMGVAPRRIDVLTDISGISFAEAAETMCVEQMLGLKLPFIGLKSMLVNKLASGRPKDLVDVDQLRRALRSRETAERKPSRSKKTLR